MTPRKKIDEEAQAAPKPKRGAKNARIETPSESIPEQEAAPVDEPLEAVELTPQVVDVTADEGLEALVDTQTTVEPSLADIDRMVVFHLADQRYAIPISAVQEIQQIVALAEVPSGFDAVIGMINLRGRVIPAFDMRLLIGLPVQEYHVDTPMIICKAGDQLIAVVVDEVEDVVVLPEGCLSAPPRMHALSGRMIAVCRLGMDLIYLLDIEKLMAPLSSPEGKVV